MTDTLAKRKPSELRTLIEGPEFRAQLAKGLPNAMSPERFVRITITSTMRNPRLLDCTRETFFRCVLDLAAMGLEPDGRQAHLIPRKNKAGGTDCTMIIDYKGIKELLYRHGDIIDEHSDVVGELDIFECEYGSNKHLRHVPNTRDRGKIYAAYSFITLPKGGTTFDVMSAEEVEAIRRRSAYPDGDPWTRDWSEMAKKTVFKRLAKSLPLSPKTRDALELDNTYEMQPDAPQAPTRAVIGGRKQHDLSQESASGEPQNDQTANSGSEPTPEPAQAEPTSPPEPVSEVSAPDKPPGPLTQLRARLKESGFRPEELLALLKSVRLVGEEIKDLSLVPPRALGEALSDWENCLKRLELERAGANPPAGSPDNFPDFPA